MKKITLFLLLIFVSCNKNANDEKWISNLRSVSLFNKDGKLLTIEANGDVKVPKIAPDSGESIFSFDEAKTETEAFYKENGKSGYAGLKLVDGSLHQVGTKADTTSGASLSEKKDFIDFSKLIKILGSKK